MDTELILGLILTLLPIFELRAGLPIILNYVSKNNLAAFPFIIAVLLLNIAAIFLAFFFLDFLHVHLLRFNFYKKFQKKFLEKFQKKAKKIEDKIPKLGYLALMIFVSLPLPGSGAYSGALISWILNLDRKNSIIAISAGVLLAGLFVFLLYFGLLFGLGLN